MAGRGERKGGEGTVSYFFFFLVAEVSLVSRVKVSARVFTVQETIRRKWQSR